MNALLYYSPVGIKLRESFAWLRYQLDTLIMLIILLEVVGLVGMRLIHQLSVVFHGWRQGWFMLPHETMVPDVAPVFMSGILRLAVTIVTTLFSWHMLAAYVLLEAGNRVASRSRFDWD